MICPKCHGNGYTHEYADESATLTMAVGCTWCHCSGELHAGNMTDGELHETCGDEELLWVQAYLEISEAVGMHANEKMIRHWFSLVREAGIRASQRNVCDPDDGRNAMDGSLMR
jgi:hypothetical protein